jgi:hypothetical protein
MGASHATSAASEDFLISTVNGLGIHYRHAMRSQTPSGSNCALVVVRFFVSAIVLLVCKRPWNASPVY